MLLAILGRGIQKCNDVWVPTEDLEICAPDGAHLAERQSIDDRSPHCRIGGGDLNLEAGAMLITSLEPGARYAVCAYGSRAPYLVEAEGPSESEVMSGCLQTVVDDLAQEDDQWQKTEIIVWPGDKVVPGRSNTHKELQNIFELALEREVSELQIVTVAVHVPRVAVFVNDLLVDNPAWREISFAVSSSEDVLLAADPAAHAPRILAMFASQAYQRTAFFEERGTKAFLESPEMY